MQKKERFALTSDARVKDTAVPEPHILARIGGIESARRYAPMHARTHIRTCTERERAAHLLFFLPQWAFERVDHDARSVGDPEETSAGGGPNTRARARERASSENSDI